MMYHRHCNADDTFFLILVNRNPLNQVYIVVKQFGKSND